MSAGEALAGARLAGLLGAAGEAVGMGVRGADAADEAAMDAALFSAASMAGRYAAWSALAGDGEAVVEGVVDGGWEGGVFGADAGALAAALGPRSPRSVDGVRLAMRVRARASADLEAWLLWWGSGGAGGADERYRGGAAAASRLELLDRAAVLVSDRLAVAASGGGYAGAAAWASEARGVSLTEVEMRAMVSVGSRELVGALEALAAGNGGDAARLLGEAERLGVVVRAASALSGGERRFGAAGTGGLDAARAAGVSRWASELAWVGRSVDPGARGAVEAYLVLESERLVGGARR